MRRTRGFSFRPYFLFLLLSTMKKRGGEDFVGFRWSEIEKRSIRARLANNREDTFRSLVDFLLSTNLVNHQSLSPPLPDLNLKSLTLAIFLSFIFSTVDFQNSTWKKRLFLFPPFFWSLETVKGSSNRRNTGIPVGGRLAGRLYLNWRATMYDWDAWKCHGTCLTSGSTLQLQSRRRNPPVLLAFFVLAKNQIARRIFSRLNSSKLWIFFFPKTRAENGRFCTEEGVEEKKNVGKINSRPRSEGGEGEIKMLSRRVKRTNLYVWRGRMDEWKFGWMRSKRWAKPGRWSSRLALSRAFHGIRICRIGLSTLLCLTFGFCLCLPVIYLLNRFETDTTPHASSRVKTSLNELVERRKI